MWQLRLSKRVEELERQVRDLELITGLRGHTTQSWEDNVMIVTIHDDETGEIKDCTFSTQTDI